MGDDVDFSISTDTAEDQPVRSEQDILTALASLQSNEIEFLILSTGPQNYVQVAGDNAGYIVERRSGDAESHSFATHSGDAPNSEIPPTDDMRGDKDSANNFLFQEVETILLSYFKGAPFPPYLNWRSSEMKEESPTYGVATLVIIVAVIGLLIALAIRYFSN